MIDRLRAGTAAVLAGTPVRFAYLFGSRAAGTAGPRSDVDIAVHLGGTPATTDLLLALTGRFEDLSGCESDVVVLDTASLRLVHRVLGCPLVLYGADEPERVRYEATMRRMATDFARHADALDREMLRATAAGRR